MHFSFFSHDNWKTNCSRRVFYEWTAAEMYRNMKIARDDSTETRLQWLMWPFERTSERGLCCSFAMISEPAEMGLSMIVVALKPLWLDRPRTTNSKIQYQCMTSNGEETPATATASIIVNCKYVGKIVIHCALLFDLEYFPLFDISSIQRFV